MGLWTYIERRAEQERQERKERYEEEERRARALTLSTRTWLARAVTPFTGLGDLEVVLCLAPRELVLNLADHGLAEVRFYAVDAVPMRRLKATDWLLPVAQWCHYLEDEESGCKEPPPGL